MKNTKTSVHSINTFIFYGGRREYNSFSIILFLLKRKLHFPGKTCVTLHHNLKPKCKGNMNPSRRNLNLLKKFHDIGVESTAHDPETLKSSTLSQGLKLFLSSLFSTWVVSQHDNINVNHSLCGQARVGRHRKNAFGYNHLPMVRKCIIAVLQEF